MGHSNAPAGDLSAGSRTVVLEVCAGSAGDALLAASSGADRIELCRDLGCGGLTPSPGDLACAVGSGVPVVALVRPRAGNFLYSPGEKKSILLDIARAIGSGASAVSTGALDESGRIDTDFLAEAVDAAGGSPLVFHRAFDLVPDMPEALEAVRLAGAARILTSCGAPTALEGARELARLAAQARGRIEVLPAGGIRSWNAVDVVLRTGCRQVHGSFAAPGQAAGGTLDPAEVLAARRALDAVFGPGGQDQ